MSNDNFDVTLSGDYTHQNQSGIPNTILGVFTANSSTLHSAERTSRRRRRAVYAEHHGQLVQRLHHHAGGATRPRLRALDRARGRSTTRTACARRWRVGTWNSTTNSYRGNGVGYPGMPALGGSGAVNVPVSVLDSWLPQIRAVAQFVHIAPGAIGGQPDLPRPDPAHLLGLRQHADRQQRHDLRQRAELRQDTTPTGGSVTLDWQLTDDMKLKSITGWRQITWNIGTDLDGLPESMQEVTDSQDQHQVSQEFQLPGKAVGQQAQLRRRPVLLQRERLRARLRALRHRLPVHLRLDNDVKTESYAGYLHLDYKLTTPGA